MMLVVLRFFRSIAFILFILQPLSGAALATDYKLLDVWDYMDKWQFEETTGLYHDAAGNLYAVDEQLCLVNKYNPAGDLLLRFGSCGSDNGQFNHPSGIGVDGYGYIYVSDTGNRRIQKFNSQGSFIQNWPMPKDGQGRSSEPYDIDIDTANNIYVVSYNQAKICKFSPSGGLRKTFGDNSGPGQMKNVRGVAVAPNGDVYATDELYKSSGYIGSILRFDKDGAFISRFGHDDTLPGYIGMADPGGMSIMGDSVVVALSGALNRYAFDGTFIETFAGDDNIHEQRLWVLNDVSIGPGNIVAIGSRQTMIQLFSYSPWTFVSAWSSASDKQGYFDGPADFAFAPDGTIYVADSGNHRIQKFARDGTYLDSWGASGMDYGHFNYPVSLDVDAQGYVYVSDYLNYRIQKFDADGTFIRAWGVQGSGYMQFQGVAMLRFGPDGNLYTLDRWNARIQVFDTEGGFVNMWGTVGGEPGQLLIPDAFTIDQQGHLFISDEYKRIQKFTAKGLFVAQFGGYDYDDYTFNRVEAMTFDSEGHLLALAVDQRKILTVDPVTGDVLSSFGEKGIEPEQFFFANAIRTDPDDRLYVGDGLANRVQVFQEDYGEFWTLMMPAILAGQKKK